MKLQIDTENKTIKVDENVKFDELIKVLSKILPKEWKSYTLETSGTWYWYNPIPYTYQEPWRVSDMPYTTCSVYNIEVN